MWIGESGSVYSAAHEIFVHETDVDLGSVDGRQDLWSREEDVSD